MWLHLRRDLVPRLLHSAVSCLPWPKTMTLSSGISRAIPRRRDFAASFCRSRTSPSPPTATASPLPAVGTARSSYGNPSSREIRGISFACGVHPMVTASAFSPLGYLGWCRDGFSTRSGSQRCPDLHRDEAARSYRCRAGAGPDAGKFFWYGATFGRRSSIIMPEKKSRAWSLRWGPRRGSSRGTL